MSSQSSSAAVWEDAWARAQPTLARLTPNTHRDSLPPSRVVRIGQLDSEALDQELVHILLEPLNKAVALVKPAWKSRFAPELQLLIETILYHGSLWNQGASYGAKLQGLRYIVSRRRSTRGPLTPSNLPQKLLLIHGALTILVPYLHNRLRAYALSNSWPDAPFSDKKRKAWNMLSAAESTHTALALASFVAFLWNGKYRTITDRLVGIRLVPSSGVINRDVSYEFMNRQMVWHAFTEFLLFLLPLIYPRLIRKRLLRFWTSFKGYLTTNQSGKRAIRRGPYHALPTDQCAICAENAAYSLNLADSNNAFNSLSATTSSPPPSADDLPDGAAAEDAAPSFPIHTAYVASCGDVFCYHCLVERMLRVAEDEGEREFWECIRCGEPVRSAERVTSSDTDMVASSDVSGALSDYEFSSELDTETDMSASFTYSDFSRRSDE